MEFSVSAVPGQNPAHQMDQLLPSGSLCLPPTLPVTLPPSTQPQSTEHKVPAESSGAWGQKWVMAAVFRQTHSLPVKETPQKQMPHSWGLHPHTGPTAQLPRNADQGYPNRTAQICWERSRVTLMFKNMTWELSHGFPLLDFTPGDCAGGGYRRQERCWEEITEDKRAAYRSLTQKKKKPD